MNITEAKKLFGVVNDNESVFFARVPRCVILDTSISPATKNVYYYLIARCTERITWISQRIIAVDLELSVSKVCRHIKQLERLGLISIKKLPENQNMYRIEEVSKLYGDLAGAPWPKREYYDEMAAKKENERIAKKDKCVLPERSTRVLPERSTRVLPERSSKEEELLEEELEEEKGRNRTPAATGIPSSLAIDKKTKSQNYEAEDLAIGTDWLEFALSEMKWKKPSGSWTKEKFAMDLAKIRRVMGVTYEELKYLLMFIKQDKFWQDKALSPASLLKKNSSGERKIDNILLQATKKTREKAKFQKLMEADQDPF